MTNAGGVAYTWDERGNLTHDSVFTYILRLRSGQAYNAAGRLVLAESVTSTLAYTYTAGGLRVEQAVDGDATEYAWDWASGLPEMLAGGDDLYLVGHETLGVWDGGLSLRDKLGSFGHRPKLHAVGWSQTKLQPYAR